MFAWLAGAADRLGYLLLLVLVVWLPLPLGGNRPLFWSATQVAVFGLVLLAVAGALSSGTAGALGMRGTRRVLWLLAAWVGYVFLQGVSIGPDWLSVLNPGVHGLYADARVVAPASTAWALSVNPEATRVEAMKYASYVGLLFAALALLRTHRRLRVLAVVLFVTGVMEALFGVWSASTGFRLYPERWLDGHFDVVTGTFVNRNHFGAHLAMALAIGVGLLLHSLARSSYGELQGWSDRARTLAGLALSSGGVFLFGSAAIAAGLFASVSRGAIIAFIGAFCLIAGIVLAVRGLNSTEGRWLPFLLAVTLAVVVVTGATGVLGRVLRIGGDIGGRTAQWSLTLNMVPDFWLFGIGAGAYGSAFPAYQDGSLPHASFDHAHNDYLELLVEQGVVGTLLLGLALALAAREILSALLRRRDGLMRGILLGVAVGSGAMLFHAFVEFNFRIPANAGWFYVLLGMGLVAAGLERRHKRSQDNSEEVTHERRQ